MRLTVNDTTLYFDVEGAGLVPDGAAMRERPTLIALHGGPGFDHAYFKPGLSPLAEVAQIVYIDMRGQGRSERGPVESYSLEQAADDIAAFCRTLGIERPVVLGHSAGGFVALHLALRHPEVPGRLILSNTASTVSDIMPAMERLGARHGAEVRAAGERIFVDGDFSDEAMYAFGTQVLPRYVHDPAAAGATFEASARSIFSNELATHFFQNQRAAYDLRARLGEIEQPTLVIVGESDWLCAPEDAQVMASGIRNARLVSIPKSGHYSFYEQPEQYMEAVRQFIAQ